MADRDDTDMTADEFDELFMAGEPLETVGSRQEYEGARSARVVRVSASWAVSVPLVVETSAEVVARKVTPIDPPLAHPADRPTSEYA